MNNATDMFCHLIFKIQTVELNKFWKQQTSIDVNGDVIKTAAQNPNIEFKGPAFLV